ncbi:MAG TPA: peptidoglycan-associated lipoprotein Pal [Halieaceae bacterium]|nr:peptidoglycan-associated lipoprotein Pal [Halieaceae bacterium]
MNHLPVAGKVLTLLFTAAFLVACSGSGSKEDEAAAEAARQAEIAAAEAAREAERQAAEAAAAEQRELEQAAMAAGTVFYFDFDSSVLKPEAQQALDAHIALLKTTDESVRLEGHTDERGTRDYNMALGERRANAVRDYMVVNGIASYRIETISYGEEKPVAYGSGEANWSQNRRVELVK